MNTFKRFTSQNIGTTVTPVGGYVVPASTTTTAIGLTVANTVSTAVNVSVSLYNGTVDTYIVRNALLIPGQTQILVGGDQKIVLQTGDSIRVISDTAASIDSILSVLELS